jgi:TorA maturation chaperone TorD
MSNAQRVAVAYSRLYELLRDLFLRGLTADLLSQAATIDELRVALPPVFDADENAALFQSTFGFNVFPYQSLFLDPAFLLGGAESARIRQVYATAGYAPDLSTGEPDHIGHELGLLAHLCGAEADALADGQPRAVEQARALQQRFLDEHLLWWLPCFAVALQRQPAPFYAALADVTLALVTAHRATLPAPAAHLVDRLPACAPPLDDPATGLQEIAAYLATPACTGVYLSRDDIAALARSAGLPRGFGDRRQMLTNLLRAAAEFDGVAAVAAALRGVVADFELAYIRYAGGGAACAAIAAAWRARVAAFEAMLARIAAAPSAADM